MHLLHKSTVLALLLSASFSLTGCATLTGKTTSAAAPDRTAATAPVGADIQQILAAGGIDPGTPAEPVQVAESPTAPASVAPIQVAAIPEPQPVVEAELSQTGVQNISQDQIYTFPTPAISMVPADFEDGLGANPFPAPVSVLPAPPMEERIIVISGPDAQPIEKPKKRAAPKPAPAVKSECIKLAQANIPDPECPPLQPAATAVSTGPVWQAPAITANVATPAAPVKRF